MSETTPSPNPPAPAGKPDPVMAVLSYLGLLSLIPLLTKKDDPFIQWHAKQGLVFCIALLLIQVAAFVVMTVAGAALPAFVTTILSAVIGLVFLAWLIVTVICILKAINGEKFEIPVVSGFIGKVPTP